MTARKRCPGKLAMVYAYIRDQMEPFVKPDFFFTSAANAAHAGAGKGLRGDNCSVKEYLAIEDQDGYLHVLMEGDPKVYETARQEVVEDLRRKLEKSEITEEDLRALGFVREAK